jgi:hypothetical protein
MAFTKEQLLLSPDKAAQLTKALASLGVPDPLQYLCDEATADVTRMTSGYALDAVSLRTFIRALALFKAYAFAGPAPADVQKAYEAANKELEAIAKGERKNLATTPTGSVTPSAGSWGSERKIRRHCR